MIVVNESTGSVYLSTINKPEELKRLVSSKNDKKLYFALKSINFTYHDLFQYLVKEFYPETLQLPKSRSELLSELMEVSESTFYRWKKNKKKVEEKYAERLTELIHLYTYGEEVFESKALFIEWLNAPNLHLDMKPPIEHIDSTPGIRYIKHLLDKIEYGAPV
jgi:putative toxin-antitoxin system antitoxin component (TIGR02293 family)